MYLKDYVTKDMTLQLKGIAIIFVMLGHLGLIPRAGAWGVGIFLLISGYGLTQSYLKSGLDGFFKKRILGVIIPYSIVTIIWLIVDYILGYRYNIGTAVSSIIGLNFKSVIDVTMWYIPFLMLWYIAFYVIFKLIKYDYIRVACLFLFSGLIYSNLYKLFSPDVGSNLYVLLFPLGVTISIIFSKKINISNEKVLNVLMQVVVISYIIFEISRYKSDQPKFYMISIIGASILFLVIGMLLKDIKSKMLLFIGGISFELYLFEGVFINKYRFIFNNIHDEFISVSIYFIVVAIISILYSKMIKTLIR